MTLRVLIENLVTADLTGVSKFVTFKVAADSRLKAVRTEIFQINDPTYTALTMKLYSNAAGSPGELIATSLNVHEKTALFVEDHGISNIYFQFDNISLNADALYHCVLNCSGYTATASSSAYLGWVKDYPDPFNNILERDDLIAGTDTDFTEQIISAGEYPFRFIAIVTPF